VTAVVGAGGLVISARLAWAASRVAALSASPVSRPGVPLVIVPRYVPLAWPVWSTAVVPVVSPSRQ
jgi:hypothetical protein